MRGGGVCWTPENRGTWWGKGKFDVVLLGVTSESTCGERTSHEALSALYDRERYECPILCQQRNWPAAHDSLLETISVPIWNLELTGLLPLLKHGVSTPSRLPINSYASAQL